MTGSLCGDGLDDWVGPPPYDPPTLRQLGALRLIDEAPAMYGLRASAFSGSLLYHLRQRQYISERGRKPTQMWLSEQGVEALGIEDTKRMVWSKHVRRWVPDYQHKLTVLQGNALLWIQMEEGYTAECGVADRCLNPSTLGSLTRKGLLIWKFERGEDTLLVTGAGYIAADTERKARGLVSHKQVLELQHERTMRWSRRVRSTK